MNIDRLKNNLSEQEDLSADEQKICDLIGDLEKVSAPKDFDFRLKARISSAKENNYQPSIWRTLRYVLPLTATLIIAAFVMIQGGLFSSSVEQPSIVENPKRETPVVSDSFAPNNQIAQTSNSSSEENKAEQKTPDSFVGEPETVAESKNPVNKQNKIKPVVSQTNDPVRTRDFTVRESNVNIQPERMSGNTALVNKGFIQNISVTAQEILNDIGVETENAGNKLKVKSVKANSPAERSGVRKDDIIEAIDEQKLEQGNLPPNFKGGKTITVTRDNKVLEIELKPN